MKKCSVHCNPKVKPVLSHNDRSNQRAHSIYKDKTHFNEYTCNKEQVKALQNALYKEAEANFYEFCKKRNGIAKSSGKPKGLQNFAKKENCITEMIFEIGENSTLADCQNLADEIAKLTGFTPLQVVIHRDEGHYEGDKWCEHTHAHAVFFTLDRTTGEQLCRKEKAMNPENLSKFQDIASQCLRMERGERGGNGELKVSNYKDYKAIKEQERRIKAIALEASETALEASEMKKATESRAKELKGLEMALNEREQDLIAREQKHEQEKEALSKDAESRIADNNRNFREQTRGFGFLFKNLLTFGKHKEKLEKERKAKELQILADQKEAREAAERQFQSDRYNLEKKANDYAKAYNAKKQELEKKEQELAKEREHKELMLNKSAENAIFAQKYGNILKQYANDELLSSHAPELKREREREQQREKREQQQQQRRGMGR